MSPAAMASARPGFLRVKWTRRSSFEWLMLEKTILGFWDLEGLVDEVQPKSAKPILVPSFKLRHHWVTGPLPNGGPSNVSGCQKASWMPQIQVRLRGIIPFYGPQKNQVGEI